MTTGWKIQAGPIDDPDVLAAEGAQDTMDALLPELAGGAPELEARWEALKVERDRALLRWAHRNLALRRQADLAQEESPPPPPAANEPAPPAEAGAKLVAPPPPPKLELLLRESPPPPWPREAPADPVAQSRALREAIEQIGAPPGLRHSQDVAAEVQHLDDSCGRLREWVSLSSEQKRALIGTVTARARRVQDESDTTQIDRRSLDSCFGRLTAFSKAHQPGFVYGLSRTHRPQHGSWLGDAEHWWTVLLEMLPEVPDVDVPDLDRVLARLRNALESASADDEIAAAFVAALDSSAPAEDGQLVDLAAPYFEILQRKSRLKPLRLAARRAREEALAEAEADDGTLPTDWPHFERTRGTRALIVGGERREGTRQRIEQVFGFASVDWVAPPARGEVTIVDRIGRGDVEHVLLLERFLGQDITVRLLPACERAQVLASRVGGGFGVSGVRAALEQRLGG